MRRAYPLGRGTGEVAECGVSGRSVPAAAGKTLWRSAQVRHLASLVAETDVAGVIGRAGVEAVGATVCRRSTADGGEVPQVPRPLGHGAARLVTGTLSDGVRWVVWGTGGRGSSPLCGLST